MSSSSDSEDDEYMKQLFESVDPSLFKLYKNPEERIFESKTVLEDASKSKRVELHENLEEDINISSSMKDYIYKKMLAIVELNYEFEYKNIEKKPVEYETPRSRVKLFLGADSFIKSETKSKFHKLVGIKPVIKKRVVVLESEPAKVEKISSVVVTGEQILNGKDCKHWAQKRTRNVYYYQRGGGGILYLKNP